MCVILKAICNAVMLDEPPIVKLAAAHVAPQACAVHLAIAAQLVVLADDRPLARGAPRRVPLGIVRLAKEFAVALGE